LLNTTTEAQLSEITQLFLGQPLKLHHLDDALAAVNVKLAADEISALEEPYVPHAIAGHG